MKNEAHINYKSHFDFCVKPIGIELTRGILAVRLPEQKHPKRRYVCVIDSRIVAENNVHQLLFRTNCIRLSNRIILDVSISILFRLTRTRISHESK